MVQRFISPQLSLTDYLVPDHAALHDLDGVTSVLNWGRLEGLLAPIYSSGTGRPSYPHGVMLRALLLGVWYQLSDVKLEASLARDLLFRRFCGLRLEDRAPDHSTLSRFRSQLMQHGLLDQLLAEVNAQLTAKSIIIQSGQVSIIDATVVEAHQSRPHKHKDGRSTQDAEAGWSVKQKPDGTMRAVYGYSIHANCDEDGFILKETVTAGNAHDSTQRDALLTGQEAQLYADSAYASAQTDDVLEAANIDNQVQRKGYRNKPLSEADIARNKMIAVTRGRIEAVFGDWKQHRGLHKTRFLGLAKNAVHFALVAIMHNIQKAARFVARYGLPEPQAYGA